MNRLLTCPHCGPTLTAARLRCDRCGRELVYISEAEFSGSKPLGQEPEERSASARHARLWMGVSAAAVIVVALAGLALPGRQEPVPAAPDMKAQPPAPLIARPAGVANVDDSRPPAVPPEPERPRDLGRTLEHYRAALAEKPADAELLDGVGQILVTMNRPAEAVPFLEKAVEAEPFSIVARFDLAGAYARSGRPKEAAEQYETLVQTGAADHRVYHNLGLALRQLGRNAEAAAAFKQATTLGPGEARGWLGLALSLEADGRRADAASALERYVALEPSAPDADNARARIVRLRSAAEAPATPAEAANGAARRGP